MNFRSLSGGMAVFFEEPGEDFFGLYIQKNLPARLHLACPCQQLQPSMPHNGGC